MPFASLVNFPVAREYDQTSQTEDSHRPEWAYQEGVTIKSAWRVCVGSSSSFLGTQSRYATSRPSPVPHLSPSEQVEDIPSPPRRLLKGVAALTIN